jgi:hypothetical protein
MARFVVGSMVLRGTSTKVLMLALPCGAAETTATLEGLLLALLPIDTACMALIGARIAQTD